MRSAVELIVKKRDGHELTPAEVRALVSGLLSGEIADYQMSAFLMASFFRGMSDAETVALTEAMLHSGDVLKLSSVKLPKVDKHSTGGVGDKISLCLAPLVACCGVAVPMISGRGLGHTGGTLDKLEAIPGFRVDLPPARFERIVRDVGTAMIGQTARIAPADKRLYALRDVTGTVECIPLIVASILSKKLAEGIDGLVLDVKAGRGAFMKDARAARKLARALVSVGERAGKRVVALVTDMSTPIGLTIGNGLETREAIEVLQNRGPADTRELTLALGAEMLLMGKVTRSQRQARAALERALGDGSAFERFLRLVRAQGGDVRAVERPERLTHAKARVAVRATRAGKVTGIDPLELGLVSVALGAGRSRAEQKVDPRAGIEIAAPLGTSVARGEPLAWLQAGRTALAEAQIERVRAAFTLGGSAPKAGRLLLERIPRR
ncbi:MAG TPA: thymidine phosphorylase [Polyangiaceae bacterium]|nr:thymidine phosphorylase [Polyangiaceae bacterium]